MQIEIPFNWNNLHSAIAIRTQENIIPRQANHGAN